MPVRKAAPKDQAETVETTGDLIEEKVVKFAEQLGWLVGTVKARTDGWLDRQTLSEEIGRIRDSAADLLGQVKGQPPRKRATKRKASSGTRPSRGPVDAPGKRHRKPLPPERIDKRMGEPQGKKMGKKSVKMGKRRVRG